jgi:hypothetical protein
MRGYWAFNGVQNFDAAGAYPTAPHKASTNLSLEGKFCDIHNLMDDFGVI